jgi:hypothetical protein
MKAFHLDGSSSRAQPERAAARADTVLAHHAHGRSGQFSRGQADEVAIYNSALSAATIAQHYNLGHNG